MNHPRKISGNSLESQPFVKFLRLGRRLEVDGQSGLVTKVDNALDEGSACAATLVGRMNSEGVDVWTKKCK